LTGLDNRVSELSLVFLPVQLARITILNDTVVDFVYIQPNEDIHFETRIVLDSFIELTNPGKVKETNQELQGLAEPYQFRDSLFEDFIRVVSNKY
jgi:hypothetical protein